MEGLVAHVDMRRLLEFHRQRGVDREASHIGQHQVHKGRFEDQFDVLELVPVKSKLLSPLLCQLVLIHFGQVTWQSLYQNQLL